MTTTHRNRLLTTISNTPGSAGALTISTAQSGYRTFGPADDGLSFSPTYVDGTAWEQRTGAIYTHATTSLSRGTLVDSSTGSAIALTSATVVTDSPTASLANALEVAMQSIIPGGRLTLESGVPVSTTDQTAKTTIYYTPYVHDTIPLWDGEQWMPTTFAETSLALGALTSGKPYDVFGYLSAGQLVLELLAWTNDTTRATAVTLQDGRYCKSGDKTRLLLGSFYTTATTTTEDSQINRYLANVYNTVSRSLGFVFAGGSHTYAVNAFREWGNVTNRASVVSPFGMAPLVSLFSRTIQPGTGLRTIATYLGVDAVDNSGVIELLNVQAANIDMATGAALSTPLTPGRHQLVAVERSWSATSVTFYSGYLSAVVVI